MDVVTPLMGIADFLVRTIKRPTSTEVIAKLKMDSESRKMAKPRIALVVGNGLSMSFGKYTGLSDEWNSQSLLDGRWIAHTTGAFSKPASLIKKLQQLSLTLATSKYSKVAKHAPLQPTKHPPRNCLIEARHFLTIAFSKLASLQLEQFDRNWGGSNGWSTIKRTYRALSL